MKKHSQNAEGRFLYMISLFGAYKTLLYLTHVRLGYLEYTIFFIMTLLYYILGIFILRERYNFRELVISSGINLVLFTLLSLLNNSIILLEVSIIFTIFQNLIRYMIGLKYQKSEKIIIVGNTEERKKIERLLLKNRIYTYVGYIAREEKESLGKIEDIEEIIKVNQVTKIIYMQEKEYLDIMCLLKLKGIKIVESDCFIQSIEGKIEVDKIDKEWFLHSKGFDVLHSTIEKRIKRFTDILLALIVFLSGLPLMIVTYILVKLDNPLHFISNPAFFKQKRIGMGGREFEIIKFRSMKLHDPKKYSKYASKTDDRITLIGRFIRKIRLDELPQVINVLKGDMSFVGPRPEWNELGREYEKEVNMYWLRYAIKPGLTGWAQVMYPYGSSLEDAKRKLEYDIYYLKYQNFILDIIILFKTVKIVFFGKGV